MGAREDAIRTAADHVERTRARLEEGRATLDRLQGAIELNRDHIDGMSRWIEETERHVDAQRPLGRDSDEAAG